MRRSFFLNEISIEICLSFRVNVLNKRLLHRRVLIKEIKLRSSFVLSLFRSLVSSILPLLLATTADNDDKWRCDLI